MKKDLPEFIFLKDEPQTKSEVSYGRFYHSSIAPALKKILKDEKCIFADTRLKAFVYSTSIFGKEFSNNIFMSSKERSTKVKKGIFVVGSQKILIAKPFKRIFVPCKTLKTSCKPNNFYGTFSKISIETSAIIN